MKLSDIPGISIHAFVCVNRSLFKSVHCIEHSETEEGKTHVSFTYCGVTET